MDLPDIGRYRRRFIVEFGPEDSGLVDRMGEVHKTKRAAIIAGLRLLDSGELERLRERVSALEADLASAQVELEQAEASLAKQMAASKKAKPAAAQTAADLRAERQAHAAAQTELERLKADGAAGQRAHAGLAAERDRLAALIPHYAYCGYCDKLVPESEWAEQPARNGFDVYHKPDGYRAKGSTWSGAASVLFWRPKAGSPSAEEGSS
jgi:hypothetical protein